MSLTIPAVPVAQPRPRAVSNGKHARMHEVTHIKNSDGTRKPHPIAAFKATVRLAAQQEFTEAPLEGPVIVDAVFVFPRPKRLIWKTKPMPRVPHDAKPDRDNLDKAVLDALSGILWRDDAQVFDGRLTKWIASGDEQPHVELTVQTFDHGEENG